MDTRILIADRQDMFREVLKRLLGSQKDFIVVGDTDDGQELPRLVSDLKPDVLLMALQLRRHSGLEALHEVVTHRPEVRPIVLSDSTDHSKIVHALLCGARGVVRKDAPVDLLFKSIRSVMNGEYWVSRKEVVELVQNLRLATARAEQSVEIQTQGLSSRERQIVEAIEAGCTNREIAKELHLSERTVKYHLTRIFNKCGVAGRMELARYSMKRKTARGA
jgi:DNA-binding NarL/FixJ family response regulator